MMEMQDQDESLYEHYAFTADRGQQPLRVDKDFPFIIIFNRKIWEVNLFKIINKGI